MRVTMTESPTTPWYTHVRLILLVLLFSFVLNQAPYAFSSKAHSIGDDGDSGFHVAIQMKLGDPGLFPKDIELNEMGLHSRPAFEFTIHRIVRWLADHFFEGNLFAANTAGFWVYHLIFVAGCYLLGLAVVKSCGGAALFAATSVGLSMALVSWWGMVYAAVIPHDIGSAMVPWFVLGYLRWLWQPQKLAVMFCALGLAVNVYPLQPTFLAIALLAVMFADRRFRLGQTLGLGIAFAAGALPSVVASAKGTFEKLAVLTPAEQAIVDALFIRHYSYLLLSSLRRTVGVIVTSPVWWFLSVAGIALIVKRRRTGLSETDKQLSAFAMWTAAIGLIGLVVGAVYRPLVTFLFHRASAFLYIPAYLGCAWMVTYWLRGRTLIYRAASIVLAFLMLFNSTQNTALFRHLRGTQPLPSRTSYYMLADWAAENTPPDSLFMVPYGPRDSYFAFRAYSRRAVLLHWGTGEIVLSHPQISKLFWDMSNDIAPLYEQESSTAGFVRVARKYDVDYIVIDHRTPLPPDLPIVYRNETYIVFAVPPKST